MSSPLVIFDLDGTLVDTATDLIDSLNHAIKPAGLPPFGLGQRSFLVGRGVKVMIERAFIFHSMILDEQNYDACYERFCEYYRNSMPGNSLPYPGSINALERLKTAGFPLAVCTNKRESLTMPLLTSLRLTDHFVTIISGDTFKFRKPDPRHILSTIERADGDPKKTVMVGDSSNDIDAAIAANIAAIAVTFGYADRPVNELGADRMIHHYDELTPDVIKSLLS